jgi:beta-glucosidase
LTSPSIKDSETLTVTFKVKNTGNVAGAEIAQLYVSDEESTIFRPKRRQKGFKKVELLPGEEKEVGSPLIAVIAYYNTEIHDWHVESGSFRILVGASSADIRLEGLVTVESSLPQAVIPDF